MMEPIQLLQINILSARDLTLVSKSMQTYATAWMNPARKMTTKVDEKNVNNPEWNDKFLFRVSPGFLHSDTTFVIEIYAQSWIRDILVGSVRVPISGIVPANPKNQARRAVALQIRRPSGRPRGILNVVVSVLDGTMHSMPLSGLDYPMSDNKSKPDGPARSDAGSTIRMRRVKSERSWSVNDEEAQARARSACNGPAGSEVGPGGSMCNSDVGPSPSVVAAAMAKGLYIPPNRVGPGGGAGGGAGGGGGMKDDGESSILQWADENSEEGLMTKIERWRMELNGTPVMHGRDDSGARYKRKHHRSKKKTKGGRLFRCFGKGYGFEFTIVCGANNHDNKKGKKVQDKKLYLPSSEGDSNSQSYAAL